MGMMMMCLASDVTGVRVLGDCVDYIGKEGGEGVTEGRSRERTGADFPALRTQITRHSSAEKAFRVSPGTAREISTIP